MSTHTKAFDDMTLDQLRERARTLHAGAIVEYSGRRYQILSVQLGEIHGPHYRLRTLGDYPNEDLTVI